MKRLATTLVLAIVVLYAGGLLSQTFSGSMTGQGSFSWGALVEVGTGLLFENPVLSVDTALVPTFLEDSASLDFDSIANGACATLPFTLTGASPGDNVAPGWPNTLESGLLGMMRATASNTITVTMCNFSGDAVDPASQTFSAWVNLSF